MYAASDILLFLEHLLDHPHIFSLAAARFIEGSKVLTEELRMLQ